MAKKRAQIMNFPELDSPVETAEMRRSAAVELFLDGKRYTPKPGLAIETRDRQAAVLGKGSVSVSQSRTSPEDPKELNNRVGSSTEEVHSFRVLLESLGKGSGAGGTQGGDSAPLDEETLQRLRSLGYVH